MTECGFCHGGPVGDAARWLDGKPRPPAPCPRCGKTFCLVCEELFINWGAHQEACRGKPSTQLEAAQPLKGTG